MPPRHLIQVVLFEDNKKTGPKLRRLIKRFLPRGSHAELFSSRNAAQNNSAYEDRLASEIKAQNYDEATLWVTDRDLSETPEYSGLSEAIVSKVATRFGVPICKYARGAADEVFDRQRNWGDAQIILEPANLVTHAAKIAVLAKGFLTISNELEHMLRNKADAKKFRTPASVMARLLNRPEAADRIALYGSGDQKMASEILPFARNSAGRKQLQKRLPSLIGYWLYDSILRFPGLLVGSVAAASYLNISESTFKHANVQKLFKSALYEGPFHEVEHPKWWRRDIDELLLKEKAANGNEYARRKLKRTIPRCLDGGRRAGFYCMVTKKPVSEENSVGNISWFPPGADLARVRKDVYEQMGPWLGLF